MTNSFVPIGVGIVVLVLMCVGIWHLSYGLRPSPPAQAIIPSLGAPASISWNSHGDVQIRGTQNLDAVTALGFVHGWSHAWTIVLWRQASQGRLSEWFGDEAVPADRLLRQLGIAKDAQTIEASLLPEDREFLQAFTDGVNAAFSTGDIPMRQDFVRMRLEPAPWEMWHTIAIERLFAWLTVPSSDLQTRDPRLTTIAQANRSIHRLLRVHGFEHTIAWITQSDNNSSSLYQRIVYGDIALAFFQEFSISLGQGEFIAGISLPGTPFVPFGSTQDAAWSVLPQTRVRFHAIRNENVFAFERFHGPDGSEYLARVIPDQSYIWAADIAQDSIWGLSWSGLSNATDVSSWRQLLGGKWSPFALLGGGGLWMERNGSWQVMGSPPFTSSLEQGTLAGLAPTAMHVANAIGHQPAATIGKLQSAAYSSWAAGLTPRLIQTISNHVLSPAATSALGYLDNWDYTYSRSSIAATIFDTWTEILQGPLGNQEDPLTIPESVTQDTILVADALEQSALVLVQRYGSERSRWRWENTHSNHLHFPYPPAGEDPWLPPAEKPGSGHATTLTWNPAPYLTEPAASASIEMWHQSVDWGTIWTRSHSIDPITPFGVLNVPDTVMAFPLPSATNFTTLLAPRAIHRD